MKTLLSILALAGVFTLGGAATEQWVGGNRVQAQAASSACFQNCANVRRWPAAQCQAYCKGKTRRR
jgi:hypothetical protein